MKKSLLALGVLATPLSAQTSVTIYNDGRVLVRREVPVAVSKGSSSHRISLGPLDPASLPSVAEDLLGAKSFVAIGKPIGTLQGRRDLLQTIAADHISQL